MIFKNKKLSYFVARLNLNFEKINLKAKKMDFIIEIIPYSSITAILIVFINQYYKYKRFKNFKTIYKDEKFEKLSEYEEKSRHNINRK